MIKYLLITLLVQDGENRHKHRILHTTENDDIKAAADKYASEFYGEDGELYGDDWYYFRGGSIATQVEGVIELSRYEYKLLERLFDTTEIMKRYFTIEAAGFNHEIGREEIQIHCGENGNLMIAKTDEGFVVDVYNQDDHVNTMAVWEDELTPEEEDDDKGEVGQPTGKEIEDFVDQWGQPDDEICAALDYDPKTSDDLLMVDYFWYAPKKYWICKTSSFFDKREQEIADYLRHNQ